MDVTREIYDRVVPRGWLDNLRYRRRILIWALQSEDNREDLWVACSRDILFWLSTFLWTFDPRLMWRGGQTVPFIPYPFQEDVILEMQDAVFVGRDLAIEKSRDLGLSWILLYVIAWFFQFRPMTTSLLASRKASLVDKPDDPDSLFSKLDFIFEHQPEWLAPPLKDHVDRKEMHYTNPLNGATIDGTATTGDMARGGRRTIIGIDELGAFGVQESYEALAASQKATRCRIIPSTPGACGPVGAFYDITHPPSRTKKLVVHWTQHPVQGLGTYKSEDRDRGRKLVLIDEKFWQTATVGHVRRLAPEVDIPGDPASLAREVYPFIQDGEIRAPYFDNEEIRCPVPAHLARELNLKYGGAGGPFFSEDLVQRLLNPHTCIRPLYIGDLVPDQAGEKMVFYADRDTGRLAIWCALDSENRPSRSPHYVMGADVSSGSGNTESVLSVFNATTGEQVAEFASSRVRPEQLAEIALSVGNWFEHQPPVHGSPYRSLPSPAYLIWEAQGPGSQFGDRLRELGYANLHYWEGDERNLDPSAPKRVGWYSTGGGKESVLTEFRRALKADECVLRSRQAVDELRQFVFGTNGKIVNARSLRSLDPSVARDNHADRGMAAALAWWVVRKAIVRTPEPEQRVMPDSCAARRRQEWEDRRRERAKVFTYRP